MIYFIVTACIYNNCEIRKKQYINGITKLKNIIANNGIDNYEIIIVDNNGERNTFLNDLHHKVYYTNNNSIQTINKGIKELQDIQDCINHYNICDEDFIVKLTGRYILHDNSEFIEVLKKIETKPYDCIIKYGPFFKPVDYKTRDCITGLIGMRCKYVKQIEKPEGPQIWVEWKWACVTYLIDDEKIYKVNKLGIDICPASNIYFSV